MSKAIEEYEGRAGDVRVQFKRFSDKPTDVTICIEGAYAKVLRVDTTRDGGTKKYRTDFGTLTFPKKTSSDDRTLRWNGVKVLDADGNEVRRG